MYFNLINSIETHRADGLTRPTPSHPRTHAQPRGGGAAEGEAGGAVPGPAPGVLLALGPHWHGLGGGAKGPQPVRGGGVRDVLVGIGRIAVCVRVLSSVCPSVGRSVGRPTPSYPPNKQKQALGVPGPGRGGAEAALRRAHRQPRGQASEEGALRFALRYACVCSLVSVDPPRCRGHRK